MRWQNYTRVRLLTDKYASEGAPRGALGYIIEVYDDGGYEVEFSHADGTTYAQIVARKEDLAVDEPEANSGVDKMIEDYKSRE